MLVRRREDALAGESEEKDVRSFEEDDCASLEGVCDNFEGV
jgi:hypothetical protein